MVKVVVLLLLLLLLVVVAKTFVRFDSGKKERSERKVYKTKNVQNPRKHGGGSGQNPILTQNFSQKPIFGFWRTMAI